VECVDDSFVAGLAVALGMEEVTEQKVKGRGLPVPIADVKGTGGPLTLSRFEK
jgi:hypothetical protein